MDAAPDRGIVHQVLDEFIRWRVDIDHKGQTQGTDGHGHIPPFRARRAGYQACQFLRVPQLTHTRPSTIAISSSVKPYSLYTMVHGKSDKDVRQTVQRMSQACGISNYRILVTEKELKKVPPTYISQIEAKSAE